MKPTTTTTTSVISKLYQLLQTDQLGEEERTQIESSLDQLDELKEDDSIRS